MLQDGAISRFKTEASVSEDNPTAPPQSTLNEQTKTCSKSVSCSICPFTGEHANTCCHMMQPIVSGACKPKIDEHKEETNDLTKTRTPMKAHSDDMKDRSFHCSECPYLTRRKSSLVIHIRKHAGEKRYACPECSYRSVHTGALKRHIRTHSGEKPFACPECPYRSVHTGALKRHMRTHSGEKPFACPECPYRSVHTGALKRHMKTHSGEKPFACPKCSFRSARAEALKEFF